MSNTKICSKNMELMDRQRTIQELYTYGSNKLYISVSCHNSDDFNKRSNDLFETASSMITENDAKYINNRMMQDKNIIVCIDCYDTVCQLAVIVNAPLFEETESIEQWLALHWERLYDFSELSESDGNIYEKSIENMEE